MSIYIDINGDTDEFLPKMAEHFMKHCKAKGLNGLEFSFTLQEGNNACAFTFTEKEPEQSTEIEIGPSLTTEVEEEIVEQQPPF